MYITKVATRNATIADSTSIFAVYSHPLAFNLRAYHTMDPNLIIAAILAVCLVLVYAVYYLGYAMGKTYCADRRAPGPAGFAGASRRTAAGH